MCCLSFFQQVASNGQIQKSYLNKYIRNRSKRSVLEVDLEYHKVLQELCNDYTLAPDKKEIKREILSD